MKKIDWNTAPDKGYTVYANDMFWFKIWGGKNAGKFMSNEGVISYKNDLEAFDDYQERTSSVIPPEALLIQEPRESISVRYLKQCIDIQAERGEQYDQKGTAERSFNAAASMFNTATGRDLKGSDICLILDFLKVVRQYSNPERLHEDSVLDKVSYSALWAEELNREFGRD